MTNAIGLVAGSILLLGAAAPAGAASSAAVAAGTPGYCPDDDGVTVVVDLTDLGGDVIVRCASDATGTGIDALGDAGFAVEGTQRWGTAFVCRVAGRPTASEELAVEGDPDYREQCVQTPPTSAFWAYSYADNGTSWTYSSQGASAHRVIEGGFEGWRFVLNGGPTEPGVAPVRPVVDEPEPPPPDDPPGPQEPKEPKKPKVPKESKQQQSPPAAEPRPESPGENSPRKDSPGDEPTPTDQPSEQSTDQSSPPPADPLEDQPRRGDREPTEKRRGVDERGGPTQDRPDKGEARPQPDDVEASTEGTTVTGDLPAENQVAADTDATSSTATLVGAGAVGLIAVGAGLSAYRRRSRNS